jgi:DNA polymerase III subunit epsilon
MIKRCLIVDTETTDLDPAAGRVIEVGAILYSIENRSTLASFATLLAGETNEAERINRIPPAALREVGEIRANLSAAGDVLKSMRRCADVIVCHNVEFDQQWFRNEWRELPWVCTAFDFDWPAASREAGSLIHLALEHGVGVSAAHRALTDCNLIAALFDRMPLYGRDLQQMFARAMRPKAIFQSLQPFDQNETAKAAGFKWDGSSKRWTRRLAIEDAAALPFKTLKLQEVA